MNIQPAFSENVLLPTPPDEYQKFSYSRTGAAGLSVATIFLLTSFFVGSLFFVRGKILAEWYLVFAVISSLGLGWNAYIYLYAKNFDYTFFKHKQRVFLADNPDFHPTVDVYLPSCGEDLDLLDNNYFHTKAMADEYGNAIVWALDDSHRPEVKALAEKYGFEYIARPNRGEDKKSGNMRYCFARSEGELILVFDADFCPRHDFLTETVWLFGYNSKLGVLQTPHYFQVKPEQARIERGGSLLQEIFFRVTQRGRDRYDAAICCGSNAIYRRASLAANGGSAIISRSEDVATGLVAIQAGYLVKYIPLVLAAGLSADTLRAFVNQFYRWSAGCFQTRTSKQYLWHKDVPWRIKFIYCTSALYFAVTGLGIVGYGIPGIVNILFYPQNISVVNYSFIIPAVFMVYLTRAKWSSLRWDTSIFYTAYVSNFVAFIALIDFLRGDLAGWIPTGEKRKKGSQYTRFIFFVRWVPIIGLGLCFAGAFKNFNEFTSWAWLFTVSIWLVKFWASNLILKHHERENRSDIILDVVEGYEREKEIKKYYNQEVL